MFEIRREAFKEYSTVYFQVGKFIVMIISKNKKPFQIVLHNEQNRKTSFL